LKKEPVISEHKSDSGIVSSQHKNSIRRLYDWVLGWAETPYGSPALAILAFAESSFFLIPPDILLIALSLGKPKRTFFYAALCTAGSVIGGLAGYFIGLQFMDIVGNRILVFYDLMNEFEQIGELYNQYDALAVFVAGLTPIPYKVATISAGVFKINIGTFVAASIASRGARFFAVSLLIYLFGPKIKIFIDKYFNYLAILFTILLIGGILISKLLLN
jgi:membrane protein YqaA with SNARE-associated domain